MTTIVENDPQLADLISKAVPGAVTVLTTAAELAGHLADDPTEHAVVLGPSVTVDCAVEVAEANRVLRPALGVLLVRATIDNAVLARAMRSGMREVISSDDLPSVGQAVRRAQSVARAMNNSGDKVQGGGTPGALLTVFSTKGGVGKSLVATNLGSALADRGHRVCIVDLDVEGGDVAIMLSLTPQHTLADLGRISGDLDASALESLLTSHSERLSVLAAPLHLGTAVSSESAGKALHILKAMFDVVVVDTAGSFDDHALQALDQSDLLVLVGTLDIPSLKNLKLAVGTLDLLNVPSDLWRLLVNRADPKIGLGLDEVEKTLGVHVAATLPSSREILTAVNRGEPIVRLNPGHDVSKRLIAFAATLAQEAALPGRAAPDRISEHRPRIRGLRARKAV